MPPVFFALVVFKIGSFGFPLMVPGRDFSTYASHRVGMAAFFVESGVLLAFCRG
jgi:hypothetical protein